MKIKNSHKVLSFLRINSCAIIATIITFFIIPPSNYSQVTYPDQPIKAHFISYNWNALEDVTENTYYFTYNEDKQVTTIEHYQEQNGEIELKAEETYSYTDGLLAFSKVLEYRRPEDPPKTIETNHFYFDTCLVEKTIRTESTTLPVEDISIYDSSSCRIILQLIAKDFSNTGTFKPYEKIEWLYEEDSITYKTTYRYSSITELYDTIFHERTYYNESYNIHTNVKKTFYNNQIDSSSYQYEHGPDYPSQMQLYTSFDGINWGLINIRNQNFERDTFTYNAQEFNINGTPFSETSFIYTRQFNNKNLVLKEEFFSTSYYSSSGSTANNSYEINYTYDCQDRLIKRTFENGSPYGGIRRFIYEDNPCEEEILEVEESLTTFPNPSTNFIFVEGALLNQPGVRIQIVSMDGKTIPIENDLLGLDKMRIRIDFLPVGVYAINASVGNQKATTLFIKR